MSPLGGALFLVRLTILLYGIAFRCILFIARTIYVVARFLFFAAIAGGRKLTNIVEDALCRL